MRHYLLAALPKADQALKDFTKRQAHLSIFTKQQLSHIASFITTC